MRRQSSVDERAARRFLFREQCRDVSKDRKSEVAVAVFGGLNFCYYPKKQRALNNDRNYMRFNVGTVIDYVMLYYCSLMA